MKRGYIYRQIPYQLNRDLSVLLPPIFTEQVGVRRVESLDLIKFDQSLHDFLFMMLPLRHWHCILELLSSRIIHFVIMNLSRTAPSTSNPKRVVGRPNCDIV